jgi:hypothetical protein
VKGHRQLHEVGSTVTYLRNMEALKARRALPQIGSQYLPPETNIVDLIQRNRIPGTLYIHERSTLFTEEAMRARRVAAGFDWRKGLA